MEKKKFGKVKLNQKAYTTSYPVALEDVQVSLPPVSWQMAHLSLKVSI